MSIVTVADLQVSLANYIDQSNTAPTEGGSDWAYRLNLLNRAQFAWAAEYNWPALYTEVNGLISGSTGYATISLPGDFRKLAGPFLFNDGTKTWNVPEIDPGIRTKFQGVTNNNVNTIYSSVAGTNLAVNNPFCYVLGNPRNNYSLINVPGTYPSGASIFYSYWAYPTSLASGSQTIQCPEPEYMITRTLAYYFQAKEDGRFQDMRAESDRILGDMLDKAVTLGYGGDRVAHAQDDFTRWGEA